MKNMVEIRWHGPRRTGRENRLPAAGGTRRSHRASMCRASRNTAPSAWARRSRRTTAFRTSGAPSIPTSMSRITSSWSTRRCCSRSTSRTALNPKGAIVINTHKSPDEVRPLPARLRGPRVHDRCARDFRAQRSASISPNTRPCWPRSSRSAACSTRGGSYPIWRRPSGISSPPSRRLLRATWSA